MTRNVQLKKLVTKLVCEIKLSQVTHLIIATSSIKDKFVSSVRATFCTNRKHSFDVILEITKQVYSTVQKE